MAKLLGPSVALLMMLSACGTDRESLPAHGLSVDGAQIAVHDNCHDDPRLDVTQEEASTVEVRFSVAEQSGGDCLSCTFATLDEPLNDRTVIDTTTGEAIHPDGLCFSEGIRPRP